jgi:hypothetical protein
MPYIMAIVNAIYYGNIIRAGCIQPGSSALQLEAL